MVHSPPHLPWHATEGITSTCQPQYPDIGLCSQCQDSQHWPTQKQQAYQQDIQQWYLEWEPQWEDEHQVRMLGYGAVVDQTSDPPGPTPSAPAKPPRDAHLGNKDRQGNSGPTYPSTLGETIRDICHFVTTDTDPHTDIEGTGHYTIQRGQVQRRHAPGTSKHKQDYTADMITVHDPTGRTIGMLSPDRAQTLHHNYQQTLAGRPHLATALQAKPFQRNWPTSS
jgi:hypothetical protein